MTSVLQALLKKIQPIDDRQIAHGQQIVHRFDVAVACTCPCGGKVMHYLALTTTSDCPRCGRIIGIRSIEYFRRGPLAVPEPRVQIGFIFSDEKLAARATTGVH